MHQVFNQHATTTQQPIRTTNSIKSRICTTISKRHSTTTPNKNNTTVIIPILDNTNNNNNNKQKVFEPPLLLTSISSESLPPVDINQKREEPQSFKTQQITQTPPPPEYSQFDNFQQLSYNTSFGNNSNNNFIASRANFPQNQLKNNIIIVQRSEGLSENYQFFIDSSTTFPQEQQPVGHSYIHSQQISSYPILILPQTPNTERLRSHSLPLPRNVRTSIQPPTQDERNLQNNLKIMSQLVVSNPYDNSSQQVSPLSPMPLLSSDREIYMEQFIAFIKQGSPDLLELEKESLTVLGTCPKSETKFAFWYGKYGGPFTWKYKGAPIDDLDLVCRMHDQRLPLRYVKKLVNLIRSHYGDNQLSKDAIRYIKRIDGVAFRIIEPVYMTFFGCV